MDAVIADLSIRAGGHRASSMVARRRSGRLLPPSGLRANEAFYKSDAPSQPTRQRFAELLVECVFGLRAKATIRRFFEFPVVWMRVQTEHGNPLSFFMNGL
jgi:hypothetical protein